jgi:hypothetical protein
MSGAGAGVAEMSQTQFTRAGGMDIAYQVVGSPG